MFIDFADLLKNRIFSRGQFALVLQFYLFDANAELLEQLFFESVTFLLPVLIKKWAAILNFVLSY